MTQHLAHKDRGKCREEGGREDAGGEGLQFDRSQSTPHVLLYTVLNAEQTKPQIH